MANVLIATLGDSPIVVTAMVKALRELEQIPIETVYVLYPGLETERLISLDYELIKGYLQDSCRVEGWPLNFADANSYDASTEFLRTLNTLLDQRQQVGDTVYLSLAGGRKNMSALLAVITQFYPCVKGLYHLLDRFEYNERRRNFYTIEQLVDMDEARQQKKLSPDIENIKLVKIPYQPFANADELRRYFQAAKGGEDYVVETSGLADAFFGAVFQPQAELPLELYLSQTAVEEYQSLDSTIQQNFDNYFRDMTKPGWLENHLHKKFEGKFSTDCYCSKKGGRGKNAPSERVFYYREANKIVVCQVTLHGSTYEKLINDGELWKVDHPIAMSLLQLYGEEAILLVSFGESPMIASQIYILLQTQEGLQVSLLAVLYPEGHVPIRNAANLLENLCERCTIPFEKKPINLEDVDDENACKIYLDALGQAINDLRTRYPNKQIALSLSGGRKGMSALTLFAAQKAGIEHVYHTVITDPKLEEQVERECSLTGLNNFTPLQQAERLFLDVYDYVQFDLFRIPVIPVK